MTAVRDLRYGDLFDLKDLPQYADADEQTRHVAEFAYGRVQTEHYTDGSGFWLDTSFGFLRLDPDFEVTVHGNAQHPFASRSKR